MRLRTNKSICSFSPHLFPQTIKAACPGATVNDIVLAAFLGALRKYMKKQGDAAVDAKAVLIRALCAVALPDRLKRSAGDELFNDFVMPSFELGVSATDRPARLAAAQSAMRELKGSFAGPLTMMINGVLARLGLEAFMGDTTLKAFSNHSFVYSNVPGFEEPVYVFGKAKVAAIAAYYPNVVSQTIFISYCDQLGFSLITDASVVKKPKLLTAAFVEEVEEWAKASGHRKAD